MLQVKRAIAACILASAILPPVTAQAATYYVATTGNNSSPGTSSKPWRTVAYAVSKMVAGDTTYVKGGVYSEGLIRFAKSGTSSAPIKLLNVSGTFPVISCKPPSSGASPMVLLTAGSGRASIGWITIEGFEIRNCHNGIKFKNLHNSTIRRNWIHHSKGSAIVGNGTKIVLDRNKITDNGSSTVGAHGIYTNGSYYTITNNLIYGNQHYGIQLNGSSSSAYNSSIHPGPEYAHSNNWTISNNTIAYERAASGMVVWGSTCNNARIEKNIFYENGISSSSSGTQGINFISTTCKGAVIRYNLSYASGGGATKFLGSGGTQGVHYTQSGNIVNTTKPNFVNAPGSTPPSSPNFALTSGSAATGMGVSYTSSSQLSGPTSLQVAY